MPALTLDDAYAPDDPTALSRIDRDDYLDRCRRVRVGPLVTVVFENRRTLRFRVQELARLARMTDPRSVKRELDWYAGLLPESDKLRAAVWVAMPGRRPNRALAAVREAVADGRAVLRADDGREIVGDARPGRVTDHLIGLTHWVEFRFDQAARAAFADPRRTWRLAVEADGYVYDSDPLPRAVRDSLLSDLG